GRLLGFGHAVTKHAVARHVGADVAVRGRTKLPRAHLTALDQRARPRIGPAERLEIVGIRLGQNDHVGLDKAGGLAGGRAGELAGANLLAQLLGGVHKSVLVGQGRGKAGRTTAADHSVQSPRRALAAPGTILPEVTLGVQAAENGGEPRAYRPLSSIASSSESVRA